jgi:hypothetical protein
MHDTLQKNIRGYTDSNNNFKDTTHIRGWCFHEQNAVMPLRAKYEGEIIEVTVEDRKDVIDFYKVDGRYLKCGWKFKCPRGKYVDLQAFIDGDWVTVFAYNPSQTKESNIIYIEE